jgi:hypothetical protein
MPKLPVTPGSVAISSLEQAPGFSIPSSLPKRVNTSESIPTAPGNWSAAPAKIAVSPGALERQKSDDKIVRLDPECVKSSLENGLDDSSLVEPEKPLSVEDLAEDCPSLGSVQHNKQNQNGEPLCTPCAWFWKANSCNHAKSCTYCHLCPEGELKSRKKHKIDSMKKGGQTPKSLKSPKVATPLCLNAMI